MAIDPNIKKKADDIRNKIYGKEVRESLASGLEEMSSDVVENEGRQSVVENRQDDVESQWQSVIDETTNLDVVSAPEIIAARDGEANLKARLDKDKNEVASQLDQTGRRSPVVAFSFDDGLATDINVVNIFKEFGYTCGFALYKNAPHNPDYNLYRTWQAEGFEILSHGVAHRNLSEPTTSLEVAEHEFKESKDFLESEGLEVKGWVQPFSQTHDIYLPLLRQYYSFGYTQYLGTWDKSLAESPYNAYVEGSYRLKRVSMETSTLQSCLDAIDKTIADNGLLSFYAHDYPTASLPENKLRGILNHIKNKGFEIKVLTPTEAYDEYFTPKLDDLSDLKEIAVFRDWGDQFDDNMIDSYLWGIDETSEGLVTESEGVLTLDTSADAEDKALIYSKKSLSRKLRNSLDIHFQIGTSAVGTYLELHQSKIERINDYNWNQVVLIVGHGPGGIYFRYFDNDGISYFYDNQSNTWTTSQVGFFNAPYLDKQIKTKIIYDDDVKEYIIEAIDLDNNETVRAILPVHNPRNNGKDLSLVMGETSAATVAKKIIHSVKVTV